MADGLVSFRYPQSGVGIERQTAAALLGAALADPARATVDLPARELTPPLTEADIDAVVAEAEGLLAGDVTLHSIPVSSELVIPAAVLGRSLLVHRDDTVSPPVFVVSWDPAPLRASLQPEVARLSTVPVNAELLIDITTDVVTIKPSLSTWEPDPEVLPAAVDAAARAVGRTANLPYREGAEPEVTTADIEAMGVKGLIGEFTTNHHCCENRVTNIHLIAAATDGAVVMPGETFDLNAHVGQRTTAGGYVLAPAIIGGALECCDHPANIGGGTSQWTTTLYNAVFFAGLEDIDHQPHTEVISRYPEGREATLGWPAAQPRVPQQHRARRHHPVHLHRNLGDGQDLRRQRRDQGRGGPRGEPVSAEVAMSIPAWNQAVSQHRYNYSGMITRYERNPDLPCGTRAGEVRGHRRLVDRLLPLHHLPGRPPDHRTVDLALPRPDRGHRARPRLPRPRALSGAARPSAGEEVQAEPQPPGQHPHPAGPGPHHPREQGPQRGDARPRAQAEQLEHAAQRRQEEVHGNGGGVAAHLSITYQPAPSQAASPAARPAWVANAGSASVLSVG